MSNPTIITLLSDLGTGHTALSGARAILMQQHADAEIVDITHRVTSYSLQQAAYFCREASGHFPGGTFHLLMVDIMFGDRHRMLLAKINDRYYIAPDNGILALTFGDTITDIWLCMEFSDPVGVAEWTRYAGMVIDIVLKTPQLNSIFIRFYSKNLAQLITHKPVGARLDCAILHIDNYGNVVINLSRGQFDELAGAGEVFSISLPPEERITRLSNHYNQVEEGKLLCRFNKMGLMELAVNRGSLSKKFGLELSSGKGINYGVITVDF